MLINPYGIDRGRGYEQPPQVSHGRAPVKIMLLLGLMRTREKGRRKGSEEAAGNVEMETHSHSGCTLNIGTMTGRGRELADMMERRNVDIRIVPSGNKVERE